MTLDELIALLTRIRSDTTGSWPVVFDNGEGETKNVLGLITETSEEAVILSAWEEDND